MKQPWMKFYPADWRSEPALRVTSLAARGLWIEMLSLMHEAEPRGSLIVKSRPVTNSMLAALVGSDEKTVAELVEELAENGVFSRKKNGTIYSRRMEFDENKSRKNRENGEKGGNPTLCNQTEKQESVKPSVKAKIPEARSHIPDNVSSNEDTKQRDALSILSDVLDDERCKAVMAHRRAKKLAVTPYAITLLTNQLKACRDPNAAADEMIVRGWSSVKPEWVEKAGTGPPKAANGTPAQQRQQADRDFLNSFLGVPQDDEFDGCTIELQANG